MWCPHTTEFKSNQKVSVLVSIEAAREWGFLQPECDFQKFFSRYPET